MSVDVFSRHRALAGMAFANPRALWATRGAPSSRLVSTAHATLARVLSIRLLETYYEEVKAIWEQRFEKKYGFWRGFVDTVVARYLDCGTEQAGFAVAHARGALV